MEEEARECEEEKATEQSWDDVHCEEYTEEIIPKSSIAQVQERREENDRDQSAKHAFHERSVMDLPVRALEVLRIA